MSDYHKATQLVDQYMQYMSTGNYDGVVTLYANNATLEDPVGSDIKHGIDEISAFYHGIGDAQLTCKRTGKVRFANQELVFPFECVMSNDDGTLKMEIIDHFVLDADFKIIAMRAFWGPETASMV